MPDWQSSEEARRFAIAQTAGTRRGSPPTDRRPARRGCLGCLAQLIGFLTVGLVVGCVFYVAVLKVFAPWAFYLGGQSHLLPMWQGVGRMHSDRGDYTMTVYMYPTRGGRTFNLPTVRGTGYLCTPQGERYSLRLYGAMSEKTGVDSNGKPMTLEFSHRAALAGFTGHYHDPPRIQFRGRWRNPDLVMDDGGSLAAAFLPDGTLSKSPHTYYHADSKNKVPITFHEVSPWQSWDEHCHAR